MMVAFRDAVVGEYLIYVVVLASRAQIRLIGHRNMLLKRGILHRDISLRNIMFDPRSGANSGNLGRLIDYDMARDVHDGSKMNTSNDFRRVCLAIYVFGSRPSH
jgi:serine/threonine protein kinase